MTVSALTSHVGADDLVIVDARDPADYLQGHIPGAINLCPSELEETVEVSPESEVPHLLVSATRAAEILGFHGIHHGLHVTIYDAGGGYLAARLWWILDYLGHTTKTLLDGGFASWQRETGAIESNPHRLVPATFYAAPRPPSKATFADVIGYIDNPRVTLVNALPTESFREETLPSSISLPYTATFAGVHTPLMKSRHELAALFERSGISPTTHVVCFCGVGYTASQLYFAAKLAGYNSVGLYDGSMTDWVARGGQLMPGDPGPG